MCRDQGWVLLLSFLPLVESTMSSKEAATTLRRKLRLLLWQALNKGAKASVLKGSLFSCSTAFLESTKFAEDDVGYQPPLHIQIILSRR